MNEKMRYNMSNWIKNYSNQNYNEDWKLTVDLTYKWDVKNEKVCRKWISRLKDYLNKNGVEIDGFVVNEYDRNIHNLHNHLLVWSSDSWSNTQSLIFNYWKNIGSVNIEKYDVNKGYCGYITKYLGRTNNNEWDLISNY